MSLLLSDLLESAHRALFPSRTHFTEFRTNLKKQTPSELKLGLSHPCVEEPSQGDNM